MVKKTKKSKPVKKTKKVVKKAKKVEKAKVVETAPLKVIKSLRSKIVEIKPIEQMAMLAPEEYGKEVGKVTHFFDKLSVAVIEITSPIKVGQKIKIKGSTTNFEQKIDSMQVEHKEITEAKVGQAIGMKVKDIARLNDTVYLVD